jgi:hypothetical protein
MVSSRLWLLLAHNYANAASPAFRQSHANHFDLRRQSFQQNAGHRMETQRGSNQINQRRRFLNFDSRKITLTAKLAKLQMPAHPQPIIRSL